MENTNIITREKVQKTALEALIKHNGGCVVMSPGTGKSKVAIDFIKHIQAKKILITSPRTNLKESWKQELEKWGIRNLHTIQYYYERTPIRKEAKTFEIIIENIQTCYKWTKEELIRAGYDLIIMDEIHTMATEEYGALAKNAKRLGITSVGLTGTPDDRKIEKSAFYQMYCPIIYRYHDSAKDSIINKRKYIVYQHNLNDLFQVEVKTKTSSWTAGEKKQYDYIQTQVKRGEDMIKDILEIPRNTEEYVNYFGYAQSWYWQGTGNLEQKSAGGVYMRAITTRKDFLWKLNSTATIAKAMRDIILREYSNSKVLIFSERTDQCEKVSDVCVHSKNKDEVNASNLAKFNSGEIRTLGSCYSLTLGLNLNNAGYAIMESYNGSSVQFKQRSGRVDRLPVDENAIVVFIVVKDTQSEQWFNSSVKFDETDEVEIVNNINEFKTCLRNFKDE